MRGVTENHKKDLEELFPGHFQFEEDRDYWDYIYLAEKLATLSGKKLHGKRNHINRFIEEHTWSFQPITREIVPACMDMLAQWTTANADQLYDGVEEEHVAIVRAFENFDALDLEGGALFSGDRLIAFTIGEKIADDTFNIHFEKAYSDIQGAYPMVSREFVRQILARHPEIVYINREDDMGKENLRRAKLNYFPAFMVEKYTAIWRD